MDSPATTRPLRETCQHTSVRRNEAMWNYLEDAYICNHCGYSVRPVDWKLDL